MKLNRHQHIAVESKEQALCVLAGPGTGKTHTITAKIINLLKNGISAQEIAALTFTQKAATQMRQRVINSIAEKEQLPFIGTFHLLCLKLLREYLPPKNKQFNLCTRQQQREILTSLGVSNPEKIIEKITKFKNTSISLDQKTASIYEKYEEKKKELNLLDFDDLLIKTVELLSSKTIPPLFSYIIVDEFQDINKLQYEIVKKLLKKDGCLAIFGDPDQAIYSFRGSEIDLFLNLPKDFKDLHLINLGLNYRSQANIIHASNKFITANTKRFSKKIEPVKDASFPILIIETQDEHEEAKTILKELKARMGAIDFTESYQNKNETPYSFASFAVLARTNTQLDIIRQHFIKAGIPVKTIQKDKELWLREFTNKIYELFNKNEIVSTLFKEGSLIQLLKSLDFFNCLESSERKLIEDLTKFYKKGKLIEQLQSLIDELSEITPLDLFDESMNAVSLLTLHGAKGLEFPVVFIAGFEEGLIPFSFASDTDIEEERRLFYVGMTRAMDELIITYARNRFINGKKCSLPVSSFLKEIPSEYIVHKKVRPRKDGLKQKGLF